MQVVNRVSLAFVMAFLLVPGQHSPLVAQTIHGTHIAATEGTPSQVEPAAYIGRVGPARRILTIILVPTEGSKVTAYYGRVGNIPFANVKIDMLDRIGVFPLKRPLSEGIFFENPYQIFNLGREAEADVPGSVLEGAVQFDDEGNVYTNITRFFEYKGPVGDRT